jgi:hypothetical protein
MGSDYPSPPREINQHQVIANLYPNAISAIDLSLAGLSADTIHLSILFDASPRATQDRRQRSFVPALDRSPSAARVGGNMPFTLIGP